MANLRIDIGAGMTPKEEVKAMLEVMCEHVESSVDAKVAVLSVQLANFMRALKIEHPVEVPDRCTALMPKPGGELACLRGLAMEACGKSCPEYKSTFSPAESAVEPVCKHRGKLLQEGSCKCGDGRVWECLLPGGPGKQIGRACKVDKCKGYEVSPST